MYQNQWDHKSDRMVSCIHPPPSAPTRKDLPKLHLIFTPIYHHYYCFKHLQINTMCEQPQADNMCMLKSVCSSTTRQGSYITHCPRNRTWSSADLQHSAIDKISSSASPISCWARHLPLLLLTRYMHPANDVLLQCGWYTCSVKQNWIWGGPLTWTA